MVILILPPFSLDVLLTHLLLIKYFLFWLTTIEISVLNVKEFITT